MNAPPFIQQQEILSSESWRLALRQKSEAENFKDKFQNIQKEVIRSVFG
jgi:hypothetical protein